ncbi:hypothetical protein [Streptomyces sp. enrichment culture]|uniref:hypothetical protein n=1 Tax=Streptomyces sp. enrichment culture TaxID=1795815 RepID=UPI003F5688BF
MTLATTVLAVDVWVLVLLWIQLRHIRGESRALGHARRGTRGSAGSEVQRALDQVSQIGGAVWGFRGPAPLDEQITFLTSAHSAVRAARAETPYALLRALVWALPALGFIGTAAEMARAIGGLSGTVKETGSYQDLANRLVPDVIHPLAGAFGITLFALGSSVVCHLLATAVHTREERLALDLDQLVLERLAERTRVAANTGPLESDQAAAGRALQAAMTGVAKSLTALNDQMERLTREAVRAGFPSRDESAPERHRELVKQLTSLSGQLNGIHAGIQAGLEQELVLAPVVKQPRVPGHNGRLFPGDGQA